MISILVPAFNEAERIAATVASIRQLPMECEVIVIDDGSTDATALRAEAASADIVLVQPHAGKGEALNAGFAVSRGDIVVLLDADLGPTAAEAQKLIEPVLSGAADMTVATLPRSGKGGGAGLVVRLARWGIRHYTRVVMQAPLSGQRALRRELVTDAGGFASGWGAEVSLTVQALRHAFRVKEVATEMQHRVTGRSPAAVLHRARQFVAVARVLWRLRHQNGLPAKSPRREFR